MAFALIPLLLLSVFTAFAIHHDFAFDFRTFWHASRLIAHGSSPYPSPAVVAHSHPANGDYEYFVYPPPFAYALVPISVLPFGAAAATWTALLLTCVIASLAVLGVRDWRCYGVAIASVPVLSSMRLGAVTPLLMLLLACAWRYRDEPLKAGTAVACAVVVKLFLWPLLLWLLLSRRHRAVALAGSSAVVVGLAGWAALRFDGLARYPALLKSLERTEGREGYSLSALADRLHLPDPSTSWLLLALPLALALVVACLARRGAERDGALFATAVGVALVLSPIVWLNYFALLVVLLAVRSRRLTPAWTLMLLFWGTPSPEPTAHPLWRIAYAVALALVIVAAAHWKAPARVRAPRDARATLSTAG